MTPPLSDVREKAPNEYHAGSREVQDRLGTRRLADRMVHRVQFTTEDRVFLEGCCVLFLATADAAGQPDVSHKGGLPGFVRVTGPDALAFPDYDGNGQYRSLGNLLVNPRVGLLFMDFQGRRRQRVKGEAAVHFEDPLLAAFPGALAIVRVRATEIFGNCPRYIHKMELVEYSAYVPREACVAPVPGWKARHRDVLPQRDPSVYGQPPAAPDAP